MKTTITTTGSFNVTLSISERGIAIAVPTQTVAWQDLSTAEIMDLILAFETALLIYHKEGVPNEERSND